ncbi:MAG TPA: lipid IV(A) 3-deoxy-D-manno-octulosonic acid transferase [Acidiferrobacterales bacterium]|nr:lipid IV(A) 3-deoxy-D-manno-octulosonic acid transferase [Acidiferrobacterales bacterium]
MTFYVWSLRLLVPFVLLRLLWRGLRNPAYWRRWPERFGFAPRVTGGRVIWIHAVSVGEVRAVVPLVRALQSDYPDYQLLITTTTPTGSLQVQNLFGAEVAHCYVPYDLPSAVRRFLDRVRPVLALIMEMEIWPTIFHQCRARAIPICVANARMSEASMRRYLKFPGLTQATLRQASLLAVQSRGDAERLQRMGARDEVIVVTGNLKFDIKLPPRLKESAAALRAVWGMERPVWIAASTHAGEEEQILAVHASLKKRFFSLLLILVPRHPERFAACARLARSHGFNIALRSEGMKQLGVQIDLLVGDTMGELQLLFAAADVAFIGGSLVATGGHNLLEASALGIPVIFGPHMFNFDEISRMALAHGAGRQVRNQIELSEAITAYLGDSNLRHNAGEAGKKMVEENRGALAKTLTSLAGFVKN